MIHSKFLGCQGNLGLSYRWYLLLLLPVTTGTVVASRFCFFLFPGSLFRGGLLKPQKTSRVFCLEVGQHRCAVADSKIVEVDGRCNC